MRFLIYGAGAIGLTYGWILSSKHDVTVLVRPEKLTAAQNGYQFTVHDLRAKPKKESQFEYRPAVVTEIGNNCDAVLVTVNRFQLKTVLPSLLCSTADIIFMQNNWDIQSEVSRYLPLSRCLIGFPSQVGGGREDRSIEVNLYADGTVLGEADGQHSERLVRYKQAFEQAGLTVEVKTDILDWLKIHYLQQSVSAGAMLKAGGYRTFATSYKSVKEMVYAFREGVAVCAACGVDTRKIFPANLFGMPASFVALVMKSMFLKPDTEMMVTGHMKQGLVEWIVGYYEVLKNGECAGVDMPVWKSYQPYVDEYVRRAGLDIQTL